MTHAPPSPTPSVADPSEAEARVGILHGAGYVGGALIRLLAGHPQAQLAAVTSRTFAGDPVAEAHPSLRGQVDQAFVAPSDAPLDALDAVLVAGEHGQSMHLVPELLDAGLEAPIVDLSADFRFRDASVYPEWFDVEHPAPELLDTATYGLPEWSEGPPTALIANPGCYATGITLALAPLAARDVPITAHVTALTGASGSGARPSAATHFPTRDGNVRPYKVLDHQHAPEIQQAIGAHVDLRFVPASGPWTRGIWGTAYIDGPADLAVEVVSPESGPRDRGEKFYEYEAAGVPEYWLVDPDREELVVYRLQDDRYQTAFEGREGRVESSVANGFWIEAQWLWREELPPVLDVLKRWGLL